VVHFTTSPAPAVPASEFENLFLSVIRADSGVPPEVVEEAEKKLHFIAKDRGLYFFPTCSKTKKGPLLKKKEFCQQLVQDIASGVGSVSHLYVLQKLIFSVPTTKEERVETTDERLSKFLRWSRRH
jgi:hypothetical protein